MQGIYTVESDGMYFFMNSGILQVLLNTCFGNTAIVAIRKWKHPTISYQNNRKIIALIKYIIEYIK